MVLTVIGSNKGVENNSNDATTQSAQEQTEQSTQTTSGVKFLRDVGVQTHTDWLEFRKEATGASTQTEADQEIKRLENELKECRDFLKASQERANEDPPEDLSNSQVSKLQRDVAALEQVILEGMDYVAVLKHQNSRLQLTLPYVSHTDQEIIDMKQQLEKYRDQVMSDDDFYYQMGKMWLDDKKRKDGQIQGFREELARLRGMMKHFKHVRQYLKSKKEHDARQKKLFDGKQNSRLDVEMKSSSGPNTPPILPRTWAEKGKQNNYKMPTTKPPAPKSSGGPVPPPKKFSRPNKPAPIITDRNAAPRAPKPPTKPKTNNLKRKDNHRPLPRKITRINPEDFDPTGDYDGPPSSENKSKETGPSSASSASSKPPPKSRKPRAKKPSPRSSDAYSASNYDQYKPGKKHGKKKK